MAPTQLDRNNSTDIQEAIQYWSPLLKHSGIGPTDKFIRLLRGIAACISTRSPSLDTSDLSPHQLLQFYQSVNGDYGQLFSLPPKSLACIYQKLRCSYSLQPQSSGSSNGEYAIPSIPSLKPEGFVKWWTVQLLLAPSEHALFLQNALSQYEVRDPESGELFPKLLPRQLFPKEPHEEMIRWHQAISDELYREATAAQPSTESKPPRASKHNHPPTAQHETGGSASDLIHQAAKFFSNPLSRGLDGRPTLVRHLSRGASYFFGNGGGAGGRRHSVHEKPHRRDSGTSAELHEERYEQRYRERATRRKEARETSSESESESERETRARPRDQRKSTQHRSSQRHRSHEPPMSPRMYPADAPPRKVESRQANHVVNEGFMPTHSPPFAAVVQKAQKSGGQSKIKPSAAYFGYFDVPRPSAEKPKPIEKTRHTGELSPSQLREDGSHVSEADEDEEVEEQDTTRARHAPPPPDEAATGPGKRPEARRRGTPVVGVHGRRYVNEVPWKKI